MLLDAGSSELITRHLQWCDVMGRSANTIEIRRQVLTRAAAALGPFDSMTATSILYWLGEQHVSPSSVRTYLGQLRSFYRWAVDDGHLQHDPTNRMQLPRVRRRMPRPLPMGDIDLAMHLAPRPVGTWILLGAYAGLRCLEIASVRGEDLHDQPEGLVLYVTGKFGDQRYVPAHELVVSALREYPAKGRLWDVTAKQVSRTGNQWLGQLGVGGTMHQLRHTFATQVYAHRSDLLVTQQLLGHASPATTAIYAQVSDRRLIDAVASIGR